MGNYRVLIKTYTQIYMETYGLNDMPNSLQKLKKENTETLRTKKI